MSKFETSKVVEFCAVTPRSVKELALQFQVDPLTVRKHLASMLSKGVLVSSGVRATGGRGRPFGVFTVPTQTTEATV